MNQKQIARIVTAQGWIVSSASDDVVFAKNRKGDIKMKIVANPVGDAATVSGPNGQTHHRKLNEKSLAKLMQKAKTIKLEAPVEEAPVKKEAPPAKKVVAKKAEPKKPAAKKVVAKKKTAAKKK